MADTADKPNVIQSTGAFTRRSGNLKVRTCMITVDELKNVEQALTHPPTQVNWPTAITSVIGALYVAAKAMSDAPEGKLQGTGLAVFVLSVLVIGSVVATTWKQLWQKHPHHDKALNDVQGLLSSFDDG
jgi:hypothetical protein